MNKKQIIITAVIGVLMFIAGFFTRMVSGNMKEAQMADALAVGVKEGQITMSQEEMAQGGYISTDTLKVRINDGDVQWYDGTLWHTAASVEELEKEDVFVIAQADFEEFMEQLKQEKIEAEGQQEGSGENGVGSADSQLLIGVKETPKPTSKPATKPQTQPSVQQPAQTAVTQTPVSQPGDDSSDNDSDDDSAGDSSEDNSEDNSGDNSGGGDDAPADDGDTGDGEDIGWSDDYL